MGKINAKSVGPIQREKTARKQPKVKTDEVPDGSATEVMQWVANDKRRAAAALAVEKKAETPRTSLVSSLERLVNDETGAGVANSGAGNAEA